MRQVLVQILTYLSEHDRVRVVRCSNVVTYFPLKPGYLLTQTGLGNVEVFRWPSLKFRQLAISIKYLKAK